MKPTILLLVVALFGSLSVQAMQPGSETSPDLTEIIDELQLDSEQASKLTALVQQHHNEMKARHQQHKQDRSERQQMRQQHREALLSVLNHEQLYQFENYMHELHQQRRRHPQRPASTE